MHLVPGVQSSLNHDIALGDEPAGHIAARCLTQLSQHLVPKAGEHDESLIAWIVDDFAGECCHVSCLARLGATRGGSFGCLG